MMYVLVRQCGAHTSMLSWCAEEWKVARDDVMAIGARRVMKYYRNLGLSLEGFYAAPSFSEFAGGIFWKDIRCEMLLKFSLCKRLEGFGNLSQTKVQT